MDVQGVHYEIGMGDFFFRVSLESVYLDLTTRLAQMGEHTGVELGSVLGSIERACVAGNGQLRMEKSMGLFGGSKATHLELKEFSGYRRASFRVGRKDVHVVGYAAREVGDAAEGGLTHLHIVVAASDAHVPEQLLSGIDEVLASYRFRKPETLPPVQKARAWTYDRVGGTWKTSGADSSSAGALEALVDGDFQERDVVVERRIALDDGQREVFCGTNGMSYLFRHSPGGVCVPADYVDIDLPDGRAAEARATRLVIAEPADLHRVSLGTMVLSGQRDEIIRRNLHAFGYEGKSEGLFSIYFLRNYAEK